MDSFSLPNQQSRVRILAPLSQWMATLRKRKLSNSTKFHFAALKMKRLDFFAKIIETTPRKERKKKKKQQLCFAVFNRARTTKAIDTLFRLELVPNDTSSQLPLFFFFFTSWLQSFTFFSHLEAKKFFSCFWCCNKNCPDALVLKYF